MILNQIKFFLCVLVLIPLLVLSGCIEKKSKPSFLNEFNYNIPYAPQTFDPLLQQGLNARYLLNHLYITLYKWDHTGNLIPSAAKQCTWIKFNLICQLKENLKFQDGTPILAKHFVNTLELLKENPTKDALDFNKIKFYTPDDHTLIFSADYKSLSLKHKLTQIELSPRKEKIYYKTAESVISSTNYKIKELKKNQYLTLESQKDSKLLVKIHFIDDPSTALRLYKSKILNLLTQLQVREIDKYKNSAELFKVHMVRMDGIFFNKKIDPNLKKALFHAVNFEDLKKIYKSDGMPGCPAIPTHYYSNDYCYKYDIKKSLDFLKQAQSIPKNLKLTYSAIGGDDIQRGMEWFANQWKKNLNLQISVNPLESGVFFQYVKSENFDIIRKGLPLDAPSCFEALKSFRSDDPNNVSHFKNKNFDHVVAEMESLPNESISEIQTLCDQGLSILFRDYTFLPLGPMYFSYLQDGKFKGWFINPLNVLDLENLTYIRSIN